jgi:hypothetical protein
LQTFNRAIYAPQTIYLGQLKFPKLINIVCSRALAITQVMGSVSCHAHLLGGMLGCNPLLSVHDVGAKALTFIVILN